MTINNIILLPLNIGEQYLLDNEEILKYICLNIHFPYTPYRLLSYLGY